MYTALYAKCPSCVLFFMRSVLLLVYCFICEVSFLCSTLYAMWTRAVAAQGWRRTDAEAQQVGRGRVAVQERAGIAEQLAPDRVAARALVSGVAYVVQPHVGEQFEPRAGRNSQLSTCRVNNNIAGRSMAL